MRVGASLCQETLHTKRDHQQINRILEEGRTPPEEIADETHLRLDLVRRLAWLHEYSEDLEEPERAHAAGARGERPGETGPGKIGF